MLSYAFTSLTRKQFEEIEKEEFDNIYDLFASILAKGIACQVKQGLYKEYVEKCEDLFTLRGKIDINASIKTKIQRKCRLNCVYDELSTNNIFNRIIKTTLMRLLRTEGVKKCNIDQLKKILIYFDEIDEIPLSEIRFDTLHFQRNNQTYKMLINICYFTLNSLIYTETKGKYRVESFLETQHMCTLYERFILAFYQKHYKGKIRASSSQIDWNLDESVSTAIEFLPKMQSDIMLSNGEQTLIIDAKYYAHTMQQGQFDKKTYHSHNMYQIFTYVKNHDTKCEGTTSGMLLYARTSEEIQPDGEIMLGGNKISIKTLNLNLPFSEIRFQLDQIIKQHFQI